jgi:hypothetical protein
MLIKDIQGALGQNDFFGLPIVWQKFILIFHISRVRSGNWGSTIYVVFDLGTISVAKQSWIQEVLSPLKVHIRFHRPDIQDDAYCFMIGMDSITERLPTNEPFRPYDDLQTFIGEQFVRDLIASVPE